MLQVPPSGGKKPGLICCLLSLLLLATGSPAARASQGADWQRDPLLSSLLIQQMVTDAAGLRWVATDEACTATTATKPCP